jgi:hypothetical protein
LLRIIFVSPTEKPCSFPESKVSEDIFFTFFLSLEPTPGDQGSGFVERNSAEAEVRENEG